MGARKRTGWLGAPWAHNVLGFPYIFRGALDCRATGVSEAMKLAAARALAELTREPVPDSVVIAYGGKALKMGPDYFIPKPFDPRVLWWVAPAVAKAAMESGVARITFDIADYRERLISKGSNAAYSIMHTITKEAQRDPRRIMFPHAASPRLLRAVQQIIDVGIAKPVLLGRAKEIEKLCSEMSLDLLGKVRGHRPAQRGPAALQRAAPRAAPAQGRHRGRDTVFNISPADITVQMADVVQCLGLTPRASRRSSRTRSGRPHPVSGARYPRRSRQRDCRIRVLAFRPSEPARATHRKTLYPTSPSYPVAGTLAEGLCLRQTAQAALQRDHP